jgi:NADH-quinone oxidoreductase subunit N
MSALGAYAAFFPEMILSASALILMLVAAYAGDGASRLIGWLAVAALALAGLHLAHPTVNAAGLVFNGLYSADAFAAFAKALIFAAAAACILVAPRFFDEDGGTRGGGMRAEYAVLILLACVGMSIMVSAADFLTLYVGLELNSLSAYVLAAFMRRDVRSAEAGLKYFVLGGLASGILLYGLSLLYGFSGTTNFSGVATAIEASISANGYLGGGLVFGLVFVLVGLGFKISAVPMHMWTPDVYEGAPTPVTAFFASAPKVAAMALTVRVAVDALGPQISWQPIIIFAALVSIVWGAVAAIPQTNIKRLLAYSSINNVGFALIGLAAGTPAGIAAVMSYLAIYVVMTIGSFVCVLQMKDKDGRPVETIDSLAGLSQTRPGLAAALAIFMFSIAGIPPLFGFWAKFLVFDAAVAANLTALAAFGIAASVIGAFYYLKIVKTMYFDAPAGEGFSPVRSALDYGIIALCAVVIVFGYLLNPVLDSASAAAAAALF